MWANLYYILLNKRQLLAWHSTIVKLYIDYPFGTKKKKKQLYQRCLELRECFYFYYWRTKLQHKMNTDYYLFNVIHMAACTGSKTAKKKKKESLCKSCCTIFILKHYSIKIRWRQMVCVRSDDKWSSVLYVLNSVMSKLHTKKKVITNLPLVLCIVSIQCI